MRIWSWKVREVDTNHESFEDGTVKADTIEEALEKIGKYMSEAYKGIKLEVSSVSLECEVTIE